MDRDRELERFVEIEEGTGAMTREALELEIYTARVLDL